MKFKNLCFFFLLFFSTSFSQIFDSTITETDTLKFADSTTIIFVDTVRTDTTLVDSLQKEKPDTLVSLYVKPLSAFSSFISHKNILQTDYESTADILKLFPFTFVNEHGTYGYPNEVYIYGTDFRNINFLKNGLLLNHRSDGGFNLNLLQSELIDSVEIVTLPRGFLSSFENNLVSVNFIEKDFLSPTPYTKIKYYEGPFGQALFDGIFNSLITNRMNFFLEVTNRKGDESYENTDFTSWQAAAKLKYLFSNELNFTGSYNFDDYNVGLNGGIDIDSISKRTSNIEALLYDEISAPVNSLTGRENNLQHNFTLQTLWQSAENFYSDLKLYYLFDQNSLNNVYSGGATSKLKSYNFGINFKQSFAHPFFALDLIGNYENTDFYYSTDNRNSSDRYYNSSTLSVSPIASFYFADSLIIPSVFLKYSSSKNPLNDKLAGYGFDFNIFLGKLKFYLGYSGIKTFLNEYKGNFELGSSFNSQNLIADLKFFSVSDIIETPNFPHYFFTNSVYEYLPIQYDLTGIGLTLKYQLWKILFENYNYFYFKNNLSDYVNVSPRDYNFNTGIYFKDILFNENLDLKTGFVLHLKKGTPANPNRSESIRTLYAETNYHIDFTLSGIIRKVAVIYFNWENLTNNNYFIIPFYPMTERNIRFGISWELFN